MKRRSFAEFLRNKLKANGLKMFLIAFSVSFLTLGLMRFFTLKATLHSNLVSSKAVLEKAASASDWDLILVVIDNLKSTSNFSYFEAAGLGRINSGSGNDSFFSMCEISPSDFAIIRSVEGCIQIFDLSSFLYLIFCLMIFSIVFFLYRRVIDLSAAEISEEIMETISSVDALLSASRITEHGQHYMEFSSFVEHAGDVIRRLSAYETDRAIFASARQVSHDIRSPLAALEMLAGCLNELPEEKRVIIRNSIIRIRDIANTLVSHKKSIVKEAASLDSTIELNLEVALLSPLVEAIVSEKRVQYRDYGNVEINYFQSEDSYGLFARVDQVQLKVVLSNIIDNAIEALPNNRGEVLVQLSPKSEHQVKFEVLDTGVGIPHEILGKLGHRGATYNKKGGSGLGLAHAKAVLAKVGGELGFKSNPTAKNQYVTAIEIVLPRELAPAWFVPKLTVSQSSLIVSVDDDISIHQIWRERFEHLGSGSSSISLLQFSNPNDFKLYFRSQFESLAEAIFLVDYEFLNHNETGLDLIVGLGIQGQAFLVTSRYEEPEIRDMCERIGVKLIPKPMSGFVPIEIVKNQH